MEGRAHEDAAQVSPHTNVTGTGLERSHAGVEATRKRPTAKGPELELDPKPLSRAWQMC